MVIDRVYTYRTPEACAIPFECHTCGRTIERMEDHKRADTHTVVNGQRIGRTYFFHLTCVPDWARNPA